ncbi:MAG: protein kinase, partial [Isosphaeraceae bacterium]
MGDSCFSDMGRMPDDGDLDETDPKADILTSDFALVTPMAEGAAPAGLGTEVTLADGRSPAATERPVPSVPGYEIVRELGRGGMGVVYLAHQGRLNRLCALKMILAGAHANSEASGRFLTEAEAVARLHHPGIIQIHCIGEAGGLPFIEFEYVDGGSLDQGLDGTPWPPRRATALVEQLTRAVAEAHRRGIVHRDLKPANILLSSDGTPKITDFGLAKSLGINADLTRTNSILGSPSYMAPEQADGKTRDVGPAADLYSLGAILYELLTGRPPFRGATVLETLEQVKGTEAVPPSRLVPGLSRDLETICLVCLRKEPERRYASAGALAEDLRRSLSGETILARRRGPAQRAWRWCRRNPMVAALAASVLLLLTALAIGSSIAAFRLNAQRNAILAHQHRAERAEAQRRVLLVDSLLSAEPDVVPFLVDSLRPARNHVLPRLRRMFADPAGSSRQQLRVAVALTLLGEPKSLFLIESIPTAPVNECRNLVSALATVKCSVVDDLRRHAETARDPATLARFASVLLSLGEPGVARNTLAPRDDPAERVALTHGFAAWHGSLNALPDLFRSTNDPAFRSSLAAAVGLIEPGTLLPEERIGLERALSDLHRDDPTAATHSATGWALRHWGIKPPTIAPTPAPSLGRHWFVNGQGMTLVEVPPGIFVMGGPRGIVPHWVALTRTVFMSDREVRADSFERFVADPRCPAEEKPKDWPGINKDVSPTGDCP